MTIRTLESRVKEIPSKIYYMILFSVINLLSLSRLAASLSE